MVEPGLPELLAEHRERVTFTTSPLDLRPCAFSFLARDVPTDEAGDGDLTTIERLFVLVANALASDGVSPSSASPPNRPQQIRSRIGGWRRVAASDTSRRR